MTTPANQSGLPLAAGAAADTVDDQQNSTSSGPAVGSADADADAARSGADADLDDANRDSDGVPVGLDDADEDARQSGADGR
jgi:hypothetical protein